MKALRFVLLLLLAVSSRACTIFVVTDGQRTLFCNNEDWSDPKTYIWFVPGSGSRLGCAYVGFGNQWGQGGVNTAGLAYDWVAGFKDEWARDPKLRNPRGNSAERMLESCRTVDDAVAFYQKYWEPDFSRSRILVADRTGASAIIGAKNGKLSVERETTCRGFGFAHSTLDKLLPQQPEPTVTRAFEILKLSRQSGTYATKYANVYDLVAGEIYLRPTGEDDEPIRLVLADELAKGRHFYELPRIREQLKEPPRSFRRWKEIGKTVRGWF